MARGQPVAVGPGAGRGRLRGAALAPALRARRRPDPPDRGGRGAAPGRGAPALQPHRHRLGRARRSLHAGTEAQQARYLPRPAQSGEEIWCQLFSEPGGRQRSRLARPPGRNERRRRVGRRTAKRSGPPWPSSGHDTGSSSPGPIRTSRSTRASPTSSARWTLPGIEIRPIIEMTGAATRSTRSSSTDVRLAADQRHRRGATAGWEPGQGDPGQRAGVLVLRRRPVGDGPLEAADLLDIAGEGERRRGRIRFSDSVWPRSASSTEEILRLIRLRTVTSARIRG